MLMTKLPEIVDGNPVKMALSLAKAIIEIKDVRTLSSYSLRVHEASVV